MTVYMNRRGLKLVAEAIERRLEHWQNAFDDAPKRTPAHDEASMNRHAALSILKAIAEGELEHMSDDFRAWTVGAGLLEGDAMDLLHRDDISTEQREHLTKFVQDWERWQELADLPL